MTPLQEEALVLIGRLWRGDWSGYNFDGRDGQRWINIVLADEETEIRLLIQQLKKLKDSY